jgi:predicted nucleic acid-binding protein
VKVALDTNVIAYAEGVNPGLKRAAATDIVGRLPTSAVIVPVQALGELFNVLVRKAGRSRTAARAAVQYWGNAFSIIETSQVIFLAAADLAAAHRLNIWDAVILAAAAQAKCGLLLSEDMQEGFTWGGVMVTNPFAPARHPLLEALLTE